MASMVAPREAQLRASTMVAASRRALVLAGALLAGWFIAGESGAAPSPCDARDADAQLGWQGVRVSRGASGAIALWSRREVWISRDDGVTFTPLADRPGEVAAVAVGAASTVFVIRATAASETAGKSFLEVHPPGR